MVTTPSSTTTPDTATKATPAAAATPASTETGSTKKASPASSTKSSLSSAAPERSFSEKCKSTGNSAKSMASNAWAKAKSLFWGVLGLPKALYNKITGGIKALFWGTWNGAVGLVTPKKPVPQTPVPPSPNPKPSSIFDTITENPKESAADFAKQPIPFIGRVVAATLAGPKGFQEWATQKDSPWIEFIAEFKGLFDHKEIFAKENQILGQLQALSNPFGPEKPNEFFIELAQKNPNLIAKAICKTSEKIIAALGDEKSNIGGAKVLRELFGTLLPQFAEKVKEEPALIKEFYSLKDTGAIKAFLASHLPTNADKTILDEADLPLWELQSKEYAAFLGQQVNAVNLVEAFKTSLIEEITPADLDICAEHLKEQYPVIAAVATACKAYAENEDTTTKAARQLSEAYNVLSSFYAQLS